VEVRIDGQEPLRFLLDSGASLVAISKRVAADSSFQAMTFNPILGAPSVRSPSENVGIGEAVRIPELRVGSFAFADVPAAVFDFTPFDEATWTRVDGVLPACAFRGSLLVFDSPRRTVSVRSGELPTPDGGDVLAFQGDRPYVETTVGGETRRTLLDTGFSGSTIVPDRIAASLRFRSLTSLAGKSRTLSGDTDTGAGRLDGGMAIGRWRLHDPIVDVEPADDCMIGSGVLREFRVTYDFARGRVRLERSDDAPIESASVRDIGAGLLHRAGAWIVAYVRDGGPADRAGLHVGARVVEIEGHVFGDLSRDDYGALVSSRDSLRLIVERDDARREVVVPVETLVK